MFTRPATWLKRIVAPVSMLACAAGMQTAAPSAQGESVHSSHPVFDGSYMRPPGPSWACDASTQIPRIAPPVYEGVTQIRQWPEHVVIVNQFRPARTIRVTAESTSMQPRGLRASWDGDVLVVDAAPVRWQPPAPALAGVVGDEGVWTTERYRRVDPDTLAVDFVVHKGGAVEVWGIEFLLRRTTAAFIAGSTIERCAGGAPR
jgi:hypothetical protein